MRHGRAIPDVDLERSSHIAAVLGLSHIRNSATSKLHKPALSPPAPIRPSNGYHTAERVHLCMHQAPLAAVACVPRAAVFDTPSNFSSYAILLS